MVIVGYGRCFANRPNLDGMPAINAKRVYRIMRQNALLLERKTAVPPSETGAYWQSGREESNQRWCSDGFEFRCDNGKTAESRSRWTAVTVRHVMGSHYGQLRQ